VPCRRLRAPNRKYPFKKSQKGYFNFGFRPAATSDILDASPAALRLLSRFFREYRSGRQSRLPATLFAWFARSRNWGLERPAINHGLPFTSTHVGSRLTVHFVPDPDDASAGYLLMKAERRDVSASDFVLQKMLYSRYCRFSNLPCLQLLQCYRSGASQFAQCLSALGVGEAFVVVQSCQPSELVEVA